jgi:hypothetical protein
VRAAGRRAADQQRHRRAAIGAVGKAQALHLGGDVTHFFERRRDQAGQADRLRAMLAGRVQDLVAGDHHAEVDTS